MGRLAATCGWAEPGERVALRDLLAQGAERDAPMAMKDIECTEFEYGWVVVSHRAAPVRIPIHGSWHGTQPGTEGVLPGHSAVWIEKME